MFSTCFCFLKLTEKNWGGGCDFCWGNSTISNYHHDRSYFHWGHAWLPDEWGQGVKVWGRRVEFGQLGGGLNRLWKHGLKWKLWEEFVRFCFFGRVWRFVDACCIWNDMRRCFQNHSVSRTETDWLDIQWLWILRNFMATLLGGAAFQTWVIRHTAAWQQATEPRKDKKTTTGGTYTVRTTQLGLVV